MARPRTPGGPKHSEKCTVRLDVETKYRLEMISAGLGLDPMVMARKIIEHFVNSTHEGAVNAALGAVNNVVGNDQKED